MATMAAMFTIPKWEVHWEYQIRTPMDHCFLLTETLSLWSSVRPWRWKCASLWRKRVIFEPFVDTLIFRFQASYSPIRWQFQVGSPGLMGKFPVSKNQKDNLKWHGLSSFSQIISRAPNTPDTPDTGRKRLDTGLKWAPESCKILQSCT